MIEASHFDFDTAYASIDRHQLEDFDPHIYRTRDMGKSWAKITAGLPAGVYVHVVKEDPKRRGLLVAGTERGAFVSLDDGDSWQRLQLNLPVTSVRDFEIYENDLIVATHGRGIWVIDDISPLRQLTPAVVASDAYLFKPADFVYLPQGGDNGTPLQKDEPQAPNPVNGAAIDYYLKSDASGQVAVEILDAAGTVVATFSNAPAATAGGGRGGRGGGGGAESGSGASRTRRHSGDRRRSRSRRRRECTESNGSRWQVAADEGAAAAAELHSPGRLRPDSRWGERRTRRRSM